MNEFWAQINETDVSFFSPGMVGFMFAAAVVLLIVLKRGGLLWRPWGLHDLLVKLYYLYIPIVFVLIGLSWSWTSALESAFTKALEVARPSIVESSVDASKVLREAIFNQYQDGENFSASSLAAEFKRLYLEKYTESMDLGGLSGFVQPVARMLQSRVADQLAEYAEEVIIRKLGGATRLSPETVRNIWHMDITTALQGGLAVEIIADQTRAIFDSSYRFIKFLFLFLMLPVALEIAISWLFMRRGRKKRLLQEENVS